MNIVKMLITDVNKAGSFKEILFKLVKWLVIIGLLWTLITVLHIKLTLG